MLHVVPRYGVAVAGGAETAARRLCEQLARRGHEVHVLSSCATDYLTWADAQSAGTTDEEGVIVHRFKATTPRNVKSFAVTSARVLTPGPTPPYHLQHRLVHEQGPEIDGLRPWLRRRATNFDVAVFHTYLYASTLLGLPAVAKRLATLLHAAAHDEPPFRLTILDGILALADGLMFHTPEEERLYRRRFPASDAVGAVIGLGIDPPLAKPDVAAFRRRFELSNAPYLLVLGRVDPQKGTQETIDFFVAFAERHTTDLQLIVMGERPEETAAPPGVVMTGFVDEAAKAAALAGALAIVVPSYFESFSLALAEAWSYGCPALVQRTSDVLVGQADRARGGLAYSGFAAFEATLEELLAQPELARRIGRAGQHYVATQYGWDTVLRRYEALLGDTIAHHVKRRGRPSDATAS